MSALGNILPLTGYIGAEVVGSDLRALGAKEAGRVREALLEHQVLFFPRQPVLDPQELVRLAELFGEIEPPHSGLVHHPDCDDVMMVVSRKGEGGSKYNDVWHTDVSFDTTPPLGSILQAVTLPPRGGDTAFASMYAAYNALSEPIKRAIEGMEALHDGVPNFTPNLLDPNNPGGRERLRKLKLEHPGCVHPVVIQHPETGRKALFVNRGFTVRLMGLSENESRNLLNLLCDHNEQANFQVRWRWQVGDVAFWDNRCTMHYAAKDYGAEDRFMHRVTIKGTRPAA